MSDFDHFALMVFWLPFVLFAIVAALAALLGMDRTSFVDELELGIGTIRRRVPDADE